MERVYRWVRGWLGLMAILLLGSCATTYDPVQVVADEHVDFSRYRTFEIDTLLLDAEVDGQQDLLVNQMIGQALAQTLTRKGLRQDQGGRPDLRVRYLARVKTQPGVDVEHVPTEQGVWTRYWNDPVSQGRLLVNLVDTSTGNVVWKGVYTQELENPDAITRQEIERVVERLMAGYPGLTQGADKAARE